jgi:hypothetical protein
MLMGKKLPGAAHARLDLVQDHQHAAPVAELSNLSRKSESGQRMPPSPWMGSSITAQVRSSMAALRASMSLKGTKENPCSTGSKPFFDFILTRGGQGGHGAPVKGLFHGNDVRNVPVGPGP